MPMRYILPAQDATGMDLELRATATGLCGLRFLPSAPPLTKDERAAAADFGRQHAWFNKAVATLSQYLAGQRADLKGIPVDLSGQPPFRKKVQEACRKIGYGETVSYSDLAARAGNAKAVRAVGSAMRHNPIALVVPCHRVVSKGGGLGGFSAPTGPCLKERLLVLEKSGAQS